jgi:signal transduction histidine kinase
VERMQENRRRDAAVGPAGAGGMPEKALLGDLAVNLAHEIKNGLTGIYAAMQILAGALPPGDRKRAWFDEAALEIKRLDATAQDLLSFAGQPAPQRAPADLGDFLRSVAQRARNRPEVRPHRIDVSAPPDLVVALDPVLLGQALLNLVANAAQAMPSPGSIRLSARRAEGSVQIEIQDSGPGIPPEYLDSIFVPFFTTKSRGTGLGLPIAKKNVEAHGGTLRARNLEVGGSAFTVELPGG